MFASKVFTPLRTLTWAVYLGCSWTWCIGMFLPVILVSEFGNAAWWVFFIPNVMGAAAMGWVLAKPGSSEKIVAEHRTACVAFSAVTFAFHLFFLYWLTYIGLMPLSFAMVALAIGLAAGFLSRWLKRLDLLLGWAVLAISLAVFAKGLAHPVLGVDQPLVASATTAKLGLAAVCLFGFLFCPYLDVTFHRARQQTNPAAGKIAFGIGFGVIFLLMIVLTLMYAGDYALDRSPTDRFGSFGGALLVTWVAIHIASQTGFTFAAHIRALPRPRVSDMIIWATAGLLMGLAIFAIRQEMWFTVKQLQLAMLSGQLMYHLFMGFYGLVFPAYVWMFIVPLGGRVPQRSAPAIAIWITAMVIAAPMFWLGFINLKMLWLIPGVAVVVAARMLAVASERKFERRTSNVELRTSN